MNEQEERAYAFFQKEGFLPAKQESYPVFKAYENCSVFQEMSATIICAWSFAYNGLYKIINSYLCSVYFYEGKPVYFALHRPPEKAECTLQQIVDILYGLCLDAGLPFLQIKFIEDRFLKEYEELEGYDITTEFFEDDNEYAFPTKGLIDLSGGKNLNKRNRVKPFLNDERISFEPMTNENVGLCFEIEEQWCKGRDCTICQSFSGCERKAMEIMGKIFDDRVYTGFFGYYDGVPAGYVIFEKRSPELFFLYFGKANIKDFFVYLIYILVKMHFPDTLYMNMNEDMGNLGLRTFKRHLGPYELWRKNICTFVKKRDGV